jgi:hypothetical protein
VEYFWLLCEVIGVFSANYPRALLDSYSIELGTGKLSRELMIGRNAGDKFAKMTPRNNVYWSYFRINHVKTLFVNLKSLKPLKFC